MSGHSLKPLTGGFNDSRPPSERYRILGRIAAGGMAEIYLARLLGNVGVEREVVMKRLMPELQSDQEFVQMFFDEARIASQMRHPNIVQIYELGELDGSLFISMEALRGVNLRDMLARLIERKTRIPVPLGARIACGALEALAYAHRFTDPDGRILNVVHRDVSPQNIIVTYDGVVKLVDFGVAKAEGRLHQTRAGLIKGKFAYMSPEQISGGKVDPRSDLFALGEVFYELLLSRHPFFATTDLEVLRGILDADPPAPTKIEASFPKRFEEIILRALQKKPGARFQDAEEMHAAIEYYLQEQRTPATSLMLGRFVRELFADRLEMERRARETGDNGLLIASMTSGGHPEGPSGPNGMKRERRSSANRLTPEMLPERPSGPKNSVVELSSTSGELPEGAPTFIARSGYGELGARKKYFQTQVQKLFDELGSLDRSPSDPQALTTRTAEDANEIPTQRRTLSPGDLEEIRSARKPVGQNAKEKEPSREGRKRIPPSNPDPTEPMAAVEYPQDAGIAVERPRPTTAPPPEPRRQKAGLGATKAPTRSAQESAVAGETLGRAEVTSPKPPIVVGRPISELQGPRGGSPDDTTPASSLDRLGLKAFLGGLVALLLAIGYAIVLYSSTPAAFFELLVSSQPPGATILLNGRPTGQSTPTVFKNLPADQDLSVELRLEGYEPYLRTVPASTTEEKLIIDSVMRPLQGSGANGGN